MLIIDASFDTVFIVNSFIACVAGKQCLTIINFTLLEVLNISYCTFLNFICYAFTNITVNTVVFGIHIVISPTQEKSHLVKTLSSVTV